MLMQRNGSASIEVSLGDNNPRITLRPGNIRQVTDEVYNQLKMQYPEEVAMASDDDTTQVARVTLTTAEILALNTTPVALVPAPGAGYAIIVERVIATMDYVSAAYATNTQLEFRYDGSVAGDATGAEVTAASIDALLTATADKVSLINGLGAAEFAPTIDKGVSAIVATGDPVTGDSDVNVAVFYKVVSI